MNMNNVKAVLLLWLIINCFFVLVIVFPLLRAAGTETLPVAFITVGVLNIVVFLAFLIYYFVVTRRFRFAMAIFKEKGVCVEYLNEMLKIGDKLDYFQREIIASGYAYLKMFKECEYILDRLPGELTLHGRDKIFYYKLYLVLYLNTGRYKLACDLYMACRDQLDRYFANSSPVQACSYYDDASLVLAIMGDFRGADSYRALAQQKAYKDMSCAFMPYMITAELYFLDGNIPEGDRNIDAARAAITGYDRYKYPWLRDSMLTSVNNGAALAKKIRAEVFENR